MQLILRQDYLEIVFQNYPKVIPNYNSGKIVFMIFILNLHWKLKHNKTDARIYSISSSLFYCQATKDHKG